MSLLLGKPAFRRPVWLGSRLGTPDLQGAIPRGWCPICGSEIFVWGAELCTRCKKEEWRNVRKTLSQPL